MANATLSSGDKSNYEVHVGWEKNPLLITHDRGLKLTELLAQEPTPFVTLTLVSGETITIRTNTIYKVNKSNTELSRYKTPDELGMNNENREVSEEGLEKLKKAKEKLMKRL